jgi:heat shock protein HslJ/uncharacterized lipoprotein NlpE involved in copper resistance
MARLTTILAAFGILVAGAASAQAPRAAHGLDLPASFRGVLPCADCPGIRMQLDLWPDQSFHLRRAYLERGVEADTGRWHFDPWAQALVLPLGGGEIAFAVAGEARLRMLDRAREPIDSALPYELAGGPLEPAEIELRFAGTMRYMADAGLFTDCASGRAYPMAMEEAFAEVERAYLDAVGTPPDPLLMEIEARIAMRPGMDARPAEPHVIPLGLVAVRAGKFCPPRPGPDLAGTVWRLVRLGAAAVEPVADREEPHLVLAPDEARYAATVGCNRMLGEVETGDGTISFGQGASTLMACPPPLDALERDFAAMLPRAARWEIEGRGLTLRDEGGAALAQFEAAYAP